jgi:hypothetical protein
MADSEHTMEDRPTSELVNEAILEDKLVDIWPELVHKIIIDSFSSQNPSFRR